MAGGLIIQWNCVSLNTHRLNLDLLISKYSPSVVCLQETRLTPNTNMTFKNYTEYFKSNENGFGGVGILVKNTILQSPVTLRSNLQAVAVRVTIKGKAYIICSIYLPPSSSPQKSDFDHTIRQFDQPFLLCGDFNAHSPLWSAESTSGHGSLMEYVIENNYLVPLNSSQFTLQTIFN